MASYRAGLWQMGTVAIDAPYVGIALAARDREDAVKKSREWALVQDILPQTWLQVLQDGKTIHAEHWHENASIRADDKLPRQADSEPISDIN